MRNQRAVNAQAIALYLDSCGQRLRREIEEAGGWPVRLRLPLPRSDHEYEALKHWLREQRQQNGAAFAPLIDFIPIFAPEA